MTKFLTIAIVLSSLGAMAQRIPSGITFRDDSNYKPFTIASFPASEMRSGFIGSRVSIGSSTQKVYVNDGQIFDLKGGLIAKDTIGLIKVLIAEIQLREQRQAESYEREFQSNQRLYNTLRSIQNVLEPKTKKRKP